MVSPEYTPSNRRLKLYLGMNIYEIEKEQGRVWMGRKKEENK